MLKAFADFTENYPASGQMPMYTKLLDVGIKCLPKDKKALEILEFVMSANSSKVVQDLQNTHFADLPIMCRPLYQAGTAKMVALWKKDDKTYDRVIDLINLDGDGKGGWSDEKGEAVKIIDLEEKE
jgi:hypothetical protein